MKILLTTWKYRTLFFLTLSFCVVLASNCTGAGDAKPSLQQESSIEAAETAWMQMDLDSSRKNLEGVWADKGSSLAGCHISVIVLVLNNVKIHDINHLYQFRQEIME